MFSPSNREQSSSSDFRYRSLNDIRHHESPNPDAYCSRHSSAESRRLAIQSVQLANQLQQLQFNDDLNISSIHGTAIMHYRPENEALAEEKFIKRLKELIFEFMTRSGRQHSYNTIMRWTVDHDNQIKYTVVISIEEPQQI